MIVAVYNLKGGVGKTSTAVNIAAVAARRGDRTLLWDLDPQGAATFLFRVRPKVKGGARRLVTDAEVAVDAVRATDVPGLDLLPADFTYRHLDRLLGETDDPTTAFERLLDPLLEDYDTIVLDCAPSISLVSENVFRVADALLVPLLPATLSLRTLAQVRSFLADHGLDEVAVLPFFSMVDRRRALHREVVDGLRAEDPELLAAAIPVAPEVERMGLHREPVAGFAPAARVNRAYEALWDEVLERLDPFAED